tara:strand:+ start:806 stop:1351 length:546 start_codon:yes stop_codon:yes gene_type:complete
MPHENEFNPNNTENKELESYKSLLKNIKENETSIKSISNQIDIMSKVFERNLNNKKIISDEITSIKSDLNTVEERYITIYRELRSLNDINSKQVHVHSEQLKYILYRQDKIYNIPPLRLARKIKSYLIKIKTYLSKRKNKLFNQEANQEKENQYDKIITHNFEINEEPKMIRNNFKTGKLN